MAYEKQTWQTGETITQEKLNHMEEGIADMGGDGGISIIDVPLTVDGGDVGIDAHNLPTYDEVNTMFENGIVAVKICVNSGNVTVDFMHYYKDSAAYATVNGHYLVGVSSAEGWMVHEQNN